MGNPSAAACQVLRRAATAILDARETPQPLQSIFKAIKPPDASDPPFSYLAPRRLAFDQKLLFPYETAEEAVAHMQPDLREQFGAAYARLAPDDAIAVEQLTYLLQEFAWAWPSSGDEVVSLFDQARVDAALAAARADGAADGPVALVGGDVSGVQAFIYTLTAAGATKALRARSFYLQLLTEVLARMLLRRAGMPITNLLYSGGGRFTLIVPESAVTNINEWRRDLGTFLLNRHAGELYVALGAATFDARDLANPEQFRQRWRTLNEAINADKRRRFADLPAETLAETLFSPQGRGGGIDSACVVCRYQGRSEEFEPFEPDEEHNLPPAERRVICRLCQSFTDLARDLHRARFLLLTPVEPALPPRRERVEALTVLRELGVDVGLARDEQEAIGKLPRNHLTTVLGLHEAPPDELRERARDRPAIWGVRPLANETPTVLAKDLEDVDVKRWLERAPEERTKTGAVKTFGMLVAQSEGVKRLGVLRMDVDDLGDIFGFYLQGASLPRVGALSAALARFFEGWVGELCRKWNEQKGERVYVIYSGGDDLFIVGAWHVLPDLARQIREDLRAYVRNEHVHVSGGLSLHPAKFPLYQAARAAEAELDCAKERPGKDAFGFLEQVVGWGKPAEEVFTLRDRLVNALQHEAEGGLSRAVLQALQAMYLQYRQGPRNQHWRKPTSDFFFGPWIWYGVYQLSRMASRRNSESEEAKLLREIRSHLTDGSGEPAGTGGRYIERVALAARWTQLLLRKERDHALD